MARRGEGIIERYSERTAQQFGGLARKIAYPGRRGATDRLLLLPGGVIAFFELKHDDEPLNALQEKEHKVLRDLGFCVATVRDEIGFRELCTDAIAWRKNPPPYW